LSDFSIWFTSGLEHIADITAYDHILFLVALCGVWTISEWKSILIIVTAFTLGHCLTLAAAALDVIYIQTPFVEFLIPLTILATCIYNFTKKPGSGNTSIRLHFGFAFLFGLIHGLGFSYLLKSMLGVADDIVLPLFYFNIGIEIGQIVIIAFIILISFLLKKGFNISHDKWQFFLSAAAFGIALIMALERISPLIESL
jgi:hypothetical protein